MTVCRGEMVDLYCGEYDSEAYESLLKLELVEPLNRVSTGLAVGGDDGTLSSLGLLVVCGS